MFTAKQVKELEVFCATRGISVDKDNFDVINFVRQLNEKTSELFEDIQAIEIQLEELIQKHSLSRPSQGAYRIALSIDEDFNLSLERTVGGVVTPDTVDKIKEETTEKAETPNKAAKTEETETTVELEYTAQEVLQFFPANI